MSEDEAGEAGLEGETIEEEAEQTLEGAGVEDNTGGAEVELNTGGEGTREAEETEEAFTGAKGGNTSVIQHAEMFVCIF